MGHSQYSAISELCSDLARCVRTFVQQVRKGALNGAVGWLRGPYMGGSLGVLELTDWKQISWRVDV